MTGKAAAFLDRDGVLNRAIVRDGRPYPPQGLHELEVLQEAAEACRLLKTNGLLLICITNQPDIARGAAQQSVIDELNEVVRNELQLDDILVCPHDDADRCNCRKPQPGLLFHAADKYGIDLPLSFIIGDRWRDIEAGQAAGCRTVFVDRGYRERRPVGASYVASSTLDAAEWIVWVCGNRGQA